MKITAIETVRLSEHPNTLWVRVHTADGLIGLGETYYLPGAVEAVIHDMAAPALLGASAFDRERHWQQLFAQANFFGFAGAEMRAISALDIALWDLVGQYLGQPIYNLLGGRCRESIRIYNTCVNTPLYRDLDGFMERPGELAESLLAQGIPQMKIWPWDRFAPQAAGYPLDRTRRLVLGRAARARPLRAGPQGRAVDGAGDPSRRGRPDGDRHRGPLALGPQRGTADRPCPGTLRRDLDGGHHPAGRVDDLARLVRETRIPQCVSERLFTKYAFRQVLERHAAHIVMPDLIWTGGITETVKIATLADSYHLPIAPHDCTGPVNVFACLHVCLAMPNTMVMETVRGFVEGYYREIVTGPVPIREGQASLGTGAGLGVALRPEVLTRPDVSTRVSRLPEDG